MTLRRRAIPATYRRPPSALTPRASYIDLTQLHAPPEILADGVLVLTIPYFACFAPSDPDDDASRRRIAVAPVPAPGVRLKVPAMVVSSFVPPYARAGP